MKVVASGNSFRWATDVGTLASDGEAGFGPFDDVCANICIFVDARDHSDPRGAGAICPGFAAAVFCVFGGVFGGGSDCEGFDAVRCGFVVVATAGFVFGAGGREGIAFGTTGRGSGGDGGDIGVGGAGTRSFSDDPTHRVSRDNSEALGDRAVSGFCLAGNGDGDLSPRSGDGDDEV